MIWTQNQAQQHINKSSNFALAGVWMSELRIISSLQTYETRVIFGTRFYVFSYTKVWLAW